MRITVRSILQNCLLELGKFETAWEGVKSTPKLPYQAVHFMPISSTTNAIGNKPYARESGILQITLFYPTGKGTKQIEQRAELIRNHFFGQSLIEDNIQVVISEPPLIGAIFVNDDKLALPITIYFNAYELGET